jgi:hypothetical protein
MQQGKAISLRLTVSPVRSSMGSFTAGNSGELNVP